MSAHTPGPWTSYPCNLERYSRVITAKGAMVRVAYTGLNHHDQVAMTKEVYGDRMTYGPGEETAANACVIAAAPQLLEACIAMKKQLEKLSFTDEKINRALRNAFLAIDKATGGAA